ncbi:MAG: hypothetical protein K2W96_17930 [Gemmataceae bacterium]|nr:hypothetical protein [Gemmataceae bacterium]
MLCTLVLIALSAEPKAVPQSRPDLKKALDALKTREPRLPLPSPTAEEKEKAGKRGFANNGRMRALYLAPELRGDSFRAKDPNMSLDSATRTKFFWIVSRLSNCMY